MAGEHIPFLRECHGANCFNTLVALDEIPFERCSSIWSHLTGRTNPSEPTRSKKGGWAIRRWQDQKRGDGQFDAGKIKCIKSASAESKIIFDYGGRSILRLWSLITGEPDEHFGFHVVQRIEQANDCLREKLHHLLEAAQIRRDPR